MGSSLANWLDSSPRYFKLSNTYAGVCGPVCGPRRSHLRPSCASFAGRDLPVDVVGAARGFPSIVVQTDTWTANLKEFEIRVSPIPKKIKPFNIVYVNFHCGRRIRLLESCTVEGVVPLSLSAISEPLANTIGPFCLLGQPMTRASKDQVIRRPGL